MAKRYIYLNPSDLQRVVATLDRAFPYRAPEPSLWQNVISVVTGYPTTLWFDIVRATLAIIMLGIAILKWALS